jgi:hypothetical protein
VILFHQTKKSIHSLKNFPYVCFFMPPEQFFSYPAAVTITGDRAANFRPILSTHGF